MRQAAHKIQGSSRFLIHPRPLKQVTPMVPLALFSSNAALSHFPQRGPMSWLHGRGAWVAGGALFSFASYYYYCLETVPYTNRRHSIMFVSRAQELALGRAVFEQTKASARASGSLLPDMHPTVQMVKRVGMRVAKAASSPRHTMRQGWGSAGWVDPEQESAVIDEGMGDQEHMKDVGWEFVVIRSPTTNAFVVPGGKVVVFTGLIDLLSSEDELAAVLSHESAHVLARHHAERMSTQNLQMITRFFSDVFFGAHIPDAVITMGVFLPYSRLNEHEADLIGIRLMARACFDPERMISMLKKLEIKEKEAEHAARGGWGPSLPVFLRTHPLTEDRAAKVRAMLPEAQKVYSANCSSKWKTLTTWMR